MRKSTLKNLFGFLTLLCFGYIFLQPIWNYNPTAVRTTIIFTIGWISAHFSAFNDR